jgi:hypothetical protein
MAYEFAAASSRYLSTASTPVSSLPCTLACWFRITSTSNNTALVTLDSGASSRIQISNNGSTFPKRAVQAVTFNSSNSFGRIGINESSYSANEWYHAAGVFETNSIINAYFNANIGTIVTSSPEVSVSGINKILVGARTSAGAVGQFHNGQIAEVGVWNVALTAAEVSSLAKGMTCDKVRPQSLVFYAPLVRELIDQKGGLTITNNNAATVANHTRVYA